MAQILTYRHTLPLTYPPIPSKRRRNVLEEEGFVPLARVLEIDKDEKSRDPDVTGREDGLN